jgi:pimeloyl-ACP methyl ester carboxylesterase
VVLNPGFGRSASDFNDLVCRLTEDGYQTIAVQPRGVGDTRSPLLARSTLHDFAADLAAVVASTQPLAGRAHVLGRALGSRIARVFAADHPKLVGALVLMGLAGPIKPDRKLLRRYAFQTSRLMPNEKRRRLIIEQTLYAEGQRMPDYMDYRPPLGAIVRQGGAVLRTPLEDWWSAGSAPVLVIQGEQDRVAPPENARLFKREFSDRVQLLMLPRAGHALTSEQPDLIATAIITFLREHPLKRCEEGIQ